MKWFLPYLDDTEAILNNAILYNNVVLLPNTPWNTATAFVLYDISQYAETLGFTLVRLPSIDEGVVPSFCDVVWQRFERNKCIVSQFDAFQLISLSKQTLLFLSESIDACFTLQNVTLLSGFEYFLTKSSNTRLIDACHENLLTSSQFTHHQDGVYRLNNFNNKELVRHALKFVYRVSPHFEVVESTLKALLKQYPSFEAFFSAVQKTVLHQCKTIE
ncbi:hypothetical protein NI377_08945 [Vibrio parahaemolyticus]|nr:hypothetical protein [Vibrio parahaemolyticus]WMN90509.1 hypothetical protein NI381_08935 [Vibrio parahaemolyticus]WMO08166.1 hypothetical protein NI377_08945 [Vibrio parahaemolyticus]